MSVAVDKEQVVAGFINRNKDHLEFTLEDVNAYILSLWNAGCGPIRLNFTSQELKNYLDKCDGVCLRIRKNGQYTIDKSLLSTKMSEKEKIFLRNDKELAKSFDLFCRLQVDIRTPRYLLDAMGFRFIYTPLY